MAREERLASGGGEPLRPLALSAFASVVTEGRWDTQSCTRRETFGLERRLWVLREEGLVVIMMTGEVVYGVAGR